MGQFLDVIASRPSTLVITVICTVIWFYLWNYRVDVRKIAFQYKLIINDGHWWRIITAAFSHVSFLHILFNMFSLYSFGSLEADLGTKTYLKASFILVIGSELLILVYAWAAGKFFRRTQEQDVFSLGYSCVVFGLMTIFSQVSKGQISIFGLPLPSIVAPFVSLLITQLIIPNASLIGHASGIVIGFLWAFGVFSWFDDYSFFCTLSWVLIAFFGSLKLTNTDFPLPCIKLSDMNDNDQRRTARVVNGVLIYESSAPAAQDPEDIELDNIDVR